MLGKFITEATLSRVSELLQLSEEAAEEALAEACSDGMLWLRMDRVKRTVVFKQPKEAEATLTEWTEDVKGIMNGLDRIVYLIEKERMMKEVGLWNVCSISIMSCSKVVGCVNTISDYTITRCVGKGTYGSVFKGVHKQTGDIVALKRVHVFIYFSFT